MRKDITRHPIYLERYDLPALLLEQHRHPALARDIAPRWERDPLTPALLKEASIPPTWHAMLLSLRPPSSTATPIPNRPSIPHPSPVSARSRRHTLARARARIGAEGGPPLSSETIVEYVCIFAVINDRRRIGTWKGWADEAWRLLADVVPLVCPTRRDLLQRYADMRALIRRRRLSWKLAEHIVDLDPILDEFAPEGGRHAQH